MRWKCLMGFLPDDLFTRDAIVHFIPPVNQKITMVEIFNEDSYGRVVEYPMQQRDWIDLRFERSLAIRVFQKYIFLDFLTSELLLQVIHLAAQIIHL